MSNRLKKAVLGSLCFFHEIGFSRLRYLNLKSHDSCRFGDSKCLKSKTKKVNEPKIHQSSHLVGIQTSGLLSLKLEIKLLYLIHI